jgi:hypothetical protein
MLVLDIPLNDQTQNSAIFVKIGNLLRAVEEGFVADY